MVKAFDYRGVPLSKLEGMPVGKLFGMLNARQRRSLTRGITDGKRKLMDEIKRAKAGKAPDGAAPIRTHVRDLVVLPSMVGVTVAVYSGKAYQPVEIAPEMIGHYIGEYALTSKRVSHGAPGVGASRSSLYVPLK